MFIWVSKLGVPMVGFIFVTGGVLSGLGKGVVTASIGKILQFRGYRVTAIKIDPYLNVDAGLLNPYEHGEVFVTEKVWEETYDPFKIRCAEVDMDFGTYERFLDIEIPPWNNITTGQIYLSVITKERRGEFLGKTVQIIPHVTDEIKCRIRRAANKREVDFVLVELGGTVGDIEGMPFLEALRQLRLEEKKTFLIHVTLIPVLKEKGEQKTKPTQHSVKLLQGAGLQPDGIIARCKEELGQEAKRKIALFCNVPETAVFSDHDLETIYELPLILEEQGLGKYICHKLGIQQNLEESKINEWKGYVERFKRPRHHVRIVLVGKYARLSDSYVSINEALKHAAAHLNAAIEISWLESEPLEFGEGFEALNQANGILIPGGYGSRGVEGKILAVEWARKRRKPILGICFGLQMMIIEFARNVCGLKEANSTEVDPETPHPVIDSLKKEKEKWFGGTQRLGSQPIKILKGTLAHEIYRGHLDMEGIVLERHRHRYEVNPEYINLLKESGLVISGFHPEFPLVEVIELPKREHPFFFGVQAHPEFKSRVERPSPPYLAFIKAALKTK